jgi:urate oxidase
MIELAATRYGKARVHVVRVFRPAGGQHVVRDVVVRLALEGDFDGAHTTGDNSLVVATDTMKNTCYVMAKDHLGGALEEYGRALASHFLGFAQVERATAWLAERRWLPMTTSGGPASDAFVRTGDFVRTAQVAVTRDAVAIEAGVEELVVMKTARSAFAGFPREGYTSLADTDDRIMATRVTCTWRYAPGDHDWDAMHVRVMTVFRDIFAEHFSPSVQASIWIIGKAILDAEPSLDEISMTLPNLHHWQYDIGQFGLPNDFEVFVATDEPHGLIEATIRRSADHSGPAHG